MRDVIRQRRLSVAGTADAATSKMFGPDGYGPIHLGMSLDDALATGKILDGVNTEGCGSYHWAYGGDSAYVTISHDYGVKQVPAPAGTHTREGATLGMSPDKLLQLYPTGDLEERNGVVVFETSVPQDDTNNYTFLIQNGKVTYSGISSVDQTGCEAG
jgi:hypothetical protein